MNIEDVLMEEYFCSGGMCSWLPHVRGEFGRPYARYLREFLCLERRYADELGYCIYPDADQVFRSLQLTPLREVKVVIVGQDPYYNGQADGLAFSIIGRLPECGPSALETIFDAINCDNSISGNISLTRQTNSLCNWAKQGVLLLNSTLTVRHGCAGSHYGRGWEEFTNKIIKAVSDQRENVVFLLWGEKAQEKAESICNKKHDIICGPHPSASGLKKVFKQGRYFSQTNEYLGVRDSIDWCAL